MVLWLGFEAIDLYFNYNVLPIIRMLNTYVKMECIEL